MAETLNVVCPDCGAKFKAPIAYAGKKVKCKSCGIGVRVPDAPAPAAAPAGKAKPAAPPKPPVDEEDDGNPYGLAENQESGLPRCPSCAKEMEEGGVICLHCGYNNRTRVRTEQKAVYEPTPGEVWKWRAPAIACVIGIFVIIGIYVFTLFNIKTWMEGSFFENDKDARAKYLVKPSCFYIFGALLTGFLCLLMGKFAVKRLIHENKPPEQLLSE